MEKSNLLKKIWESILKYIPFFLMITFVVSSCLMLFLNQLKERMGIVFLDVYIFEAAKLTLGNVLLISFIFTLIDWVRRKIMYDVPVKRIINGCEKIINGDCSVRIPHVSYTDTGFNCIIDYFNCMAEELSKIETLRTDFITNVSHEFKMPMAIMQNYAHMIQNQNLSEEKRAEYAKGIETATRKLTNLITNILKLNKLENQEIFPKKELFDLSAQICDCLLGFEDEWEEKELNVEIEISERIIINSDAEMLTLVWNNLFSNAIKFTPRNGTVMISLKSEGKNAEVIVADTGCGISSDVGEHIFEKFYQGDTSHSTEGNGLGLALVKRVIDILGADISVKSENGNGSMFIVKLRGAQMSDSKDSFKYTYSSSQQQEIRRIREKYIEKESNKMEQLRKLDKSVETPGTITSIVGVISTLIMGTGLSFCLNFNETFFYWGIFIGIAGLIGIIATYPLYLYITDKVRKKNGPKNIGTYRGVDEVTIMKEKRFEW